MKKRKSAVKADSARENGGVEKTAEETESVMEEGTAEREVVREAAGEAAGEAVGEAVEEESAEAVAEEEVAKLKDRLLRLQADFDNYRKRMVRERQETILLSNAGLIEDLLIPLDHLDRAIESISDSSDGEDACLAGIRLVRAEFLSTLGRYGLELMQTGGADFDPAMHEAMGWTQSSEVEPEKVAVELRAGYILNGRVIRAAQVLIAAAAAEAESSPDETGAEASEEK